MSNDDNIKSLNDKLFRIDFPTRAPQVGSLLVAEPFLRESYFNHAVIALIDYAKGDSAMGIVLNKPTGYTIGEGIEGINEEIDIPIFCGGPLSHDRLFYIHTLGDEFDGARQIADGLYVGGNFEQVRQYVNMGLPTEGKIRFFVGYAGWDPYQLEGEIDNHVWAVAPIVSNSDIVTDTTDSAWYDQVRLLGPRYRNWLYHPADPQLN